MQFALIAPYTTPLMPTIWAMARRSGGKFLADEFPGNLVVESEVVVSDGEGGLAVGTSTIYGQVLGITYYVLGMKKYLILDT